MWWNGLRRVHGPGDAPAHGTYHPGMRVTVRHARRAVCGSGSGSRLLSSTGLVVGALLLAVSGCTGAGEQEGAAGPSVSDASGSDSAITAASRRFSEETRPYDDTLDALYGELNEATPSMPTLHRLAGEAREACLTYAAGLRKTAWPTEIDELAEDLAREVSTLAPLFQRMEKSASPREAVQIAEVIERRYDHAPAARLRHALGDEE